jgi:hypothetical protein
VDVETEEGSMGRTQTRQGLIPAAILALFVSSGCQGTADFVAGLLGGHPDAEEGAGLFAALTTQNGGSQDTGGTGDGSSTFESPASITNPEPASLALFGGGLAGLAALRRRRTRHPSS